MNDLDRIAHDLQYAAGAGARELTSEVTQAGRVEAQLGQRGPAPGPALIALVGEKAARRAYAATQAENSSADVGVVTSRMQTKLSDGGLALALGQR